MILPAAEVVATIESLGVTHVVWLPDSAIGPWEGTLLKSRQLRLVPVCREGEAWTIAAGLYLGGQRPLVVIQNTGLFESGDALRNVLFDLGLPLFALIGWGELTWFPIHPTPPANSPNRCCARGDSTRCSSIHRQRYEICRALSLLPGRRPPGRGGVGGRKRMKAVASIQ